MCCVRSISFYPVWQDGEEGEQHLNTTAAVSSQLPSVGVDALSICMKLHDQPPQYHMDNLLQCLPTAYRVHLYIAKMEITWGSQWNKICEV